MAEGKQKGSWLAFATALLNFLKLPTALLVALVAVWYVREGMHSTGLSNAVGKAGTVIRSVTGVEKSPDLTRPAEDLDSDAMDVASAAAIDSKGEDASHLAQVRAAIVDVHIRNHEYARKDDGKGNKIGLSYREVVGMCLAWAPDGWNYHAHAKFGVWQDRDRDKIDIKYGSTTYELYAMAKKRLKDGPGPGCATKIIRAAWHPFGRWGGEKAMADELRRALAEKRMHLDPQFRDKGFKTVFLCPGPDPGTTK